MSSPGWLPLFETLSAGIDQLLKQAPPPPIDFHWVQVKERWGTLRAYYKSQATRVDIIIPGKGVQMLKIDLSEGPKLDIWQQIEDRVDRAEAASPSLCLFCGTADTLRKSGWWKTTCDEHNDAHWDAFWPREK